MGEKAATPSTKTLLTMKGAKEMATSTTSKMTKNHLNRDLVTKAVVALLKHHEKENSNDAEDDDDADDDEKKKKKKKKKKASLLGDDLPIQVQLGLSLVPDHPSPKPIMLELPHALFSLAGRGSATSLDEAQVCLICKDDVKSKVLKMIHEFPEEMGCIKRVLSITMARRKLSTFQQRRDLVRQYDLFLADDCILPMLAKILGRSFFQTKKVPIPVSVVKAGLPHRVQRCLHSTAMFISGGTCLTVKAAHTQMSVEEITDNIMALVEKGAQKVPRQWANILTVNIKTTESVALPIYHCNVVDLDKMERDAGLVDDAMETKESPPQRSPPQKVTSPLGKALQKPKKEVSPKKRKEKEEETTPNAKEQSPGRNQKRIKKQTEDEEEVIAKEVSKTELSSRKKNTPKKEKEDKDVEAFTPSEKEEPCTSETPKETSKKQVTTEEKKGKRKDSEVLESSKKKQIKEEEEEEESGEKKTKRKESGASETPKEPKKKTTTAKAEESDAAKDEDKNEKRTFIAVKKYKGRKSGYVFKKGKDGLGYYLDQPPVPNDEAIQAMLRSFKQSPSGHIRSSGKKKRGRGRR